MGLLYLPKYFNPTFKSPRVKPAIASTVDKRNGLSSGICQSITNFVSDDVNQRPLHVTGNLALTGDRTFRSDGNQNFIDMERSILDGDFTFVCKLTFDFAAGTTKVVFSNFDSGQSGFFWLGCTGSQFRVVLDSGSLFSGTVTRNVIYTVGLVRNGTDWSLWVDGIEEDNLTEVLSPVSDELTLGKFGNNDAFNWIGKLNHCYTWDRALPAGQMRSIALQPYQILKPLRQPLYFIPDSGATALIVQDLNQSQALGVPTLTQHNILATDDLAQAQLLDSPTLTQHNILATDDLEQVQELGIPTLTPNLIVDGLTQSQLIDSPLLTQHHILTVDDLNQTQELGNVVLSVVGALVVQGLNQGQSLDNVTLTVLGALIVQGLEQSQLLDEPTLTQHNILAVDGITQSQLLDNVTLTVPSFSLLVDGLTQSQDLGVPLLTQMNVLSVDSLTQSQLLSVVNLGGLVVGYLEGELSVFSAYNGELSVTNALTGETSILS